MEERRRTSSGRSVEVGSEWLTAADTRSRTDRHAVHVSRRQAAQLTAGQPRVFDVHHGRLGPRIANRYSINVVTGSCSACLLLYHFRPPAVFQREPKSAGFPSFYICSGREPLEISEMVCYRLGVLLVAKPAVSKR